MPSFKTMLAATALSLALTACQAGGPELAARWQQDCVAAGFSDRHLGLPACVARARADHEAKAFSAAATY